MKKLFAFILGIILVAPAVAKDEPQFSHMIIFGDSLSDPGNVFALTGNQSVPPYSGLDPQLVPPAPYAKGGHKFSNGKIWIEQLATDLRLVKSARPALQVSGAKNYAFGGSRALGSPTGSPDLEDQVDLFLAGGGMAQLEDALVVIAIGSNDTRDAVVAALFGADPVPILASAAATIAAQVDRLEDMGARKFLIGSVPNLARLPAFAILESQLPVPPGTVLGLAGALSATFNFFLLTELSGLTLNVETIVAEFDVYNLVEGVIANPASVGLNNVLQSCVTPGIPPFHCQNVDDFLFWDGIHPTMAGHTALKNQALMDLSAAGLVQ